VVPATFRGRVVDLETVWAPATGLREDLLDTREPAAVLDLVEHRLSRTPTPVAGLDHCERAVAMLEADPGRPIAAIAANVGVSHGHLDRQFTRIVWLSPCVLARLLPMRRLLLDIDVAGDVPWADVAAELGWYHQAHLIRDFRRHTGVTPTGCPPRRPVRGRPCRAAADLRHARDHRSRTWRRCPAGHPEVGCELPSAAAVRAGPGAIREAGRAGPEPGRLAGRPTARADVGHVQPSGAIDRARGGR